MPPAFHLGPWLVEPSLNRLSRGDDQVRLEPKVMQVLEVLAERPGEVISRDDLVARVWAGVFVTDDVLHRAIREIRRAVGDDPGEPRYIETIRKRGYRLIAPVTPAEPHEPQRTPGTEGTLGTLPRTHGTVGTPGTLEAYPWHPWHLWHLWHPGGGAPWLLATALVIGALAASLWPSAEAARPAAAAVRFVPLTSSPFNEADPALGPGGRLAFVRLPLPGRGGQADIYLLDERGAEPRRLTDEPGDERLPVWSPDGAELAFIRADKHACTLVIRTLASGAEREVGACGNRDEPRFAWSPDGRWLVMSVADDRRSGWQIARVSIATGAREELTLPPPGIFGDHSPAVSPDGALVAFIRSAGGGASDVYVVPAAGGSARRVTEDNADMQGVDWTDDGRALVYSSDRAGGYGLWRVPVEGGAPELLVGGSAKLKHPSGGPDGEIAYESWAYEINVWEAPIAAGAAPGPEVSAPRPIIQTSELWNVHPQPSPDGTSLAFVSTRSGSQEIWLAARDGTSVRQLTRFGRASLRVPRWSPDGSRIVISALVGDAVDLYLVNPADGTTTALTSAAGDEVAPSWSPDGRRIYFGAREDGLWQVRSIDVATGEQRTETRDGGYAAQPSPDGRWLYFTRPDRSGIFRQPVAGGDAALFVDGLSAANWADWQVTQDGVYILHDGEDDELHVSRVPLDGGAPAEVATLPQFSWPGIAVSPDGRGILYARWDRRESNILAVQVSR
ncbi:MAG: winged helix-turn-helix domain-containing protein [Vicinamibacterales bacterium]